MVSINICIFKNFTSFLQIGCTFSCLHTSVQELPILYWLTTRTFDFCPCVYNDKIQVIMMRLTLSYLSRQWARCAVLCHMISPLISHSLCIWGCVTFPFLFFLAYFISLVKLIVRVRKDGEKKSTSRIQYSSQTWQQIILYLKDWGRMVALSLLLPWLHIEF